MKNLSTEPLSFYGRFQDPWLISAAIHLFFLAVALSLIFGNLRPGGKNIDIEVIEAPKVSPQAVQITEPKAPPKIPPRHEVFGVSRKALSAPDGETAKAGNTVAKAPDQEILRPGDADSLPIPSEEYLVTQMPKLKIEVRIPYPTEARKRGNQGAVVMDLLIDSGGRVREVDYIEGPDPDLNAAAVEAAKNFEFTPALIQDKPVAVKIRYSYRFVLER